MKQVSTFTKSNEQHPPVSQPDLRVFVIEGLYVLQRIGSIHEGNASFTLSGDYYNRELSGNRIYLLHVYTIWWTFFVSYICVFMFMQINQKECLSRLLFSEFDKSFNGIVKCIRMFHNRVQNKVTSVYLSLDRER